MNAADPYNLQRFVDAQEPMINQVIAELRGGRKYGHWIWFIFPQLKGLGRSSTSDFYGVSCLNEAKAYLQHPILGPRLLECTKLVNGVEGSEPEGIFGEIDAMKFRSCMTLFAQADPETGCFTEALEKYFEGDSDPLTIKCLSEGT